MKSVILLCVLSIVAFGQSGTKARPKTKPEAKSAAPAIPRISHYMQEIGLMYVEEIEERNDCRLKATELSDCDHYEKIFSHMDDELDINLTLQTDKDFHWVLQMSQILSDRIWYDHDRARWEWGTTCLYRSKGVVKSGDLDLSVGALKCTAIGLQEYVKSKTADAPAAASHSPN